MPKQRNLSIKKSEYFILREAKLPFVDLSRKIPQVYQRYGLDPEFCKTPFTDKEKMYIISWIENYLISNEKISWNSLQSDMNVVFDKLRSKNDIKNFWNSRKRRLISQAENVLDPPPIKNIFIMETFD
ncbi:hypothetical protein GLOIN_2v1477473 [Rhizophagus clarus]|uniref:HTH myb-type domain-containing protein n=1 Tax=Rhizophagus clarus TaxID=94130 RepID=A0A8H3QLU1_9GLOM|nr:hypothetical protein GLOIN_2v1477473 [Rhizophagus clarus]